MYDKDEKHTITVEDTLEILCARYPNNVDQVIDSIFDVDTGEKDAKGKPKKIKRESINYIEYRDKMHALSMERRNEINNAKKKSFVINLRMKLWKMLGVRNIIVKSGFFGFFLFFFILYYFVFLFIFD